MGLLIIILILALGYVVMCNSINKKEKIALKNKLNTINGRKVKDGDKERKKQQQIYDQAFKLAKRTVSNINSELFQVVLKRHYLDLLEEQERKQELKELMKD